MILKKPKISKEAKRIFLLILLAIVFSVLHNLIYAVTGVEEPIFFLLALVTLLLSLISLSHYMVTQLEAHKLLSLKNKRVQKIILITLLTLILILFLRFVVGGNEDSWICEKGQWVKHGVPNNPPPAKNCEIFQQSQ